MLGQISFLFQISQPFSPISEGISFVNSQLRWGRFQSTLKNRWEMWNGWNFRVITMREGGSSWPFKGRQGDTDLNWKLCCLYWFSVLTVAIGKCFQTDHFRSRHVNVGGWTTLPLVLKQIKCIFMVVMKLENWSYYSTVILKRMLSHHDATQKVWWYLASRCPRAFQRYIIWMISHQKFLDATIP